MCTDMNSFSYSSSFSLSPFPPYGNGSSAILPSSECINPTSIEAIPPRSSFPSETRSISHSRFATKTSRHAAHSIVEPIAVRRYRRRSAPLHFAFPSARFSGTLVDARSNWSFTAAFAAVSPSRSVLHETNSRLAWYTRSFSWSNFGVMGAQRSRNGDEIENEDE